MSYLQDATKVRFHISSAIVALSMKGLWFTNFQTVLELDQMTHATSLCLAV